MPKRGQIGKLGIALGKEYGKYRKPRRVEPGKQYRRVRVLRPGKGIAQPRGEY